MRLPISAQSASGRDLAGACVCHFVSCAHFAVPDDPEWQSGWLTCHSQHDTARVWRLPFDPHLMLLAAEPAASRKDVVGSSGGKHGDCCQFIPWLPAICLRLKGEGAYHSVASLPWQTCLTNPASLYFNVQLCGGRWWLPVSITCAWHAANTRGQSRPELSRFACCCAC